MLHRVVIAGVALPTAAIVLSLIALTRFAEPFIWIAAFCTSALLAGIKFAERSGVKALWFNLAVVVLALGAYESWSWLYAFRTPASRYVSLDAEGQRQPLSAPDGILGYVPVKGQSGSWERYRGADLLWKMTYSINSAGLRSGPPDSGSADMPCVLFFGGSYTFGSGVEDDETTAYQVGIKSGGRFRTHNFGHVGYGPHQMLASIQEGRVDEVVDCQPRYAVYQAIEDHVRRAAGHSSWDEQGPRFVLLPDGSVSRDGIFAPLHTGLLHGLREYLNRSRVYRKLNLLGPRIEDETLELFAAIVDEARILFERRYAGSEFHVIFWPSDHWSTAVALERMEARGLDVHRIEHAILSYSIEDPRYKVHPLDSHPNALAHSLIAEYVVREILKLEMDR